MCHVGFKMIVVQGTLVTECRQGYRLLKITSLMLRPPSLDQVYFTAQDSVSYTGVKNMWIANRVQNLYAKYITYYVFLILLLFLF